ncbi:hypothetical protein GGI42DRAFT_322165 [Trichoderma sp. SZMC 28013]
MQRPEIKHKKYQHRNCVSRRKSEQKDHGGGRANHGARWAERCRWAETQWHGLVDFLVSAVIQTALWFLEEREKKTLKIKGGMKMSCVSRCYRMTQFVLRQLGYLVPNVSSTATETLQAKKKRTDLMPGELPRGAAATGYSSRPQLENILGCQVP